MSQVLSFFLSPSRRIVGHGAVAFAAAVLFSVLPNAPVLAQNWQLVFEDTFDSGSSPDAADWNFDIGGNGWGNNEEQYYTDRSENARLEGGNLVIETLKEDFSGSAYTSARLTTRGKHDITYGRVEVRAKLPAGRGTWPAIWLLYTENKYGNGSWPDNGEIDIMEHVGFDQGRVHATIHTDSYNGGDGTQRGASTVPSPDVSTAFHVYAVEWEPNQIRAYVDDVLYFTYDRESDDWREWPFDQEFHLILNTAVGGDWGGQQGIDDSIFPQRFEIDYVRILEETDQLPTVTLDGVEDGAMFSAGDSIAAAIEAADADPGLAYVELLQGDGVLARSQAAPFDAVVRNVADGCYSLRARAVDEAGWVNTTDTVSVSVGSGCGRSPYLMAPTPIPGIVEAEYFDLGGSGVAYLDLEAANTGGGIRRDEGVDIEGTSDDGGGYNLTNVSRRDWTEYTVDVALAGIYDVNIRVASESGGSFELFVDGVTAFGQLDVLPTGGDQAWASVIRPVELSAGQHILRLRGRVAGLNINRMEFTYSGPTSLDSPDDIGSWVGKPFPNPATGFAAVPVRLDAVQDVVVSVFDARGRLLRRKDYTNIATGSTQVNVDLAGLANGVYLISVENSSTRTTHPITILRK